MRKLLQIRVSLFVSVQSQHFYHSMPIWTDIFSNYSTFLTALYRQITARGKGNSLLHWGQQDLQSAATGKQNIRYSTIAVPRATQISQIYFHLGSYRTAWIVNHGIVWMLISCRIHIYVDLTHTSQTTTFCDKYTTWIFIIIVFHFFKSWIVENDKHLIFRKRK